MLSSADRSVADRDPGLPGLAVLLDPAAFLDRLRAALPALDLRAATPTYLRYKPGTGCMAGFRLDVAGQAADVYARTLRLGDEAKLRKLAGADAGAVPGPLGASRLLLPDCGVVVRTFPYDDALPSLQLLADPARRDRLLSRMIGGAIAGDSGPVEMHTLAYKPERRYVGQVAVGGTPAAVLRLYTPAGFETATRNAKFFAMTDVVRVPARLGRSARWNAVAVEWLPGESLYSRLVEPAAGGLPAEALVRLGEAVAGIARTVPQKFPRRTHTAEANGVIEAARGVAALWPPVAERILRLADRVASELASLPPIRRPMHGDLYAKQVLVNPAGDAANGNGDHRLSLIDFDGAVQGDPIGDVANFAAHLERHAAAGDVSRDIADAAVAAVVAGYDSRAPEPPGQRLRVYTAARLLRVVPHPFRARQTDWPEQVEALLDRAESALAESSIDTRHTGVKRPSGSVKKPVLGQFSVTADPKFDFLADALHPTTAEAVLLSALSEDGDRRRFADRRLSAVRVVRHKPGRRCLIEYDWSPNDPEPNTPPFTVIGKVRAKGLDVAAHDTLCRLWRSGFASDSPDGLSVPKPLGVVPSFRMCLMDKAPGIALGSLLTRPDAPHLMSRVADLLAKLHRLRLPVRRTHTLADELHTLEERLPTVASGDTAAHDSIRRLLAACRRAVTLAAAAGMTTAECRTTCVHRDFYADQVLVADDARLFLLDLDLFAEGDPAVDLGNFVAHLIEAALRAKEDPEAFAHLQREFLGHYEDLTVRDVSLRRRVELYVSLTLARHVYISTVLPDRRPFTSALLRLSLERLTEWSPVPTTQI